MLFFSCGTKENAFKIQWDGDRATGIVIPDRFIKDLSGSPDTHINVSLVNEATPVAILGSFRKEDDAVIFEPLIPLTRGLTYAVAVDGRRVGEIKIPPVDSDKRPSLLGVYPTQDTVPVNLLKMYLHFSSPMREGDALQYLTVIKNNRDTVRGVFLELHPELWNEERTMLTLWLDPGRIKRDLQPNKRLGSPLREGEQYSVLISEKWTDQLGAQLTASFRKDFVVASRDSLSPEPDQWKIEAPSSGSTQPLLIDLRASLDYSLLLSTLQVLNEGGANVAGTWSTRNEEKEIIFEPGKNWTPGKYIIQIETRLEDLAGNNINRLFETDLLTKKKETSATAVVSLSFVIN